MGRVIAAESETKGITAAPSAVATRAPVHVDTLVACIKELAQCLRVTAHVLAKFTPSVVLSELEDLIGRRVAAVEALLDGVEE